SQPSVSVSPPSAGAGARTVYKILFATSSTGGLSPAANSHLTITLPAGTGISTMVGPSRVLDTSQTGTPQVGFCSRPSSGLVVDCLITASVGAGDQLSVELDGITNPTTPSTTETLSVSTTSDTASVTSADYGVGPGPTVTSLSPSSGPASGGTQVTITGT